MNGKSLFAVVAVVAVAVAGYLVVRNGDDSPMPSASPQATQSTAPSTTPTSSPAKSASPTPSNTASSGQLKTFAVIGNSFSFNLKEMRVKKGDRVKIVFTNTEGMHDWVIDEFSARTAKIQAGQTATIEFVADKTGSFEYYCSVGQHRAQGMRGTLVVE